MKEKQKKGITKKKTKKSGLSSATLKGFTKALEKIKVAEKYLEDEKKKLIKEKETIRNKIKKEIEILKLKKKIDIIQKRKT